jgi:hypothetical protein
VCVELGVQLDPALLASIDERAAAATAAVRAARITEHGSDENADTDTDADDDTDNTTTTNNIDTTTTTAMDTDTATTATTATTTSSEGSLDAKAAEDALAAFLLGGSSDLQLAAKAESTVRGEIFLMFIVLGVVLGYCLPFVCMYVYLFSFAATNPNPNPSYLFIYSILIFSYLSPRYLQSTFGP